MSMQLRSAKTLLHFVFFILSLVTLSALFGIVMLILYAYGRSMVGSVPFLQSLESVSLAACVVLSFPAWIAAAFVYWRMDKAWTLRKHKHGAA